MKKIAIALTTVFALTGASFAGSLDAAAPTTKQEKAPITVDLTSTQSIRDVQPSDQQQPRLGYEGSPWFITDLN